MYAVAQPKLFDDMPELGAGYHFGELKGSDNPQGVIVLNAEVALTPEEIWNVKAFEELDGIMKAGGAAGPKKEIVPSENVSLLKKSLGHLISNMRAYLARGELHASPPFYRTSIAGNFVRFSAFANDRRVLSDMSLRAGTYVTSERDAKFAPSGLAAVGRYALPNPLPAVHVFDIVIGSGVHGWVGTVAPAFGQAGGGAEVELKRATPPGSVSKRTPTLPEY